jgi:nucleoside-diphosphate-sugar epimerase
VNDSERAPARVVVLGASGFVASDLLRHLGDLRIPSVGVGSRQVDLCGADAPARLAGFVRDDDAVVVVSALTPDKGKDVGTFMRNLAMGAHLSAFFDRASCAHLIYISSDAVYADAVTLAREDSCASPSTFHGLMHLVRERMLAQAMQRIGCPLMVLRPSLLYGARDTHNGYGSNRFLRAALAAQPVTLFGAGEERRDHVYVRDLSDIIGRCLMRKSCGVLNVATGTAVSFAEVVQIIGDVSGRQVMVQSAPRATPVTHRHFDITSLVKAFPSFRPTSLRDGLRAFIEACA